MPTRRSEVGRVCRRIQIAIRTRQPQRTHRTQKGEEHAEWLATSGFPYPLCVLCVLCGCSSFWLTPIRCLLSPDHNFDELEVRRIEASTSRRSAEGALVRKKNRGADLLGE